MYSQQLDRFIICYCLLFLAQLCHAMPSECDDWKNKHTNWLWCDDFEADNQLEENYFDIDRVNGRFGVSSETSFAGSASIKGTYVTSSSSAGSLKLSIGRTPVSPKRYTDQDFEDIYWRFYMKVSLNWTGNAYKTSRATIFSGSNWSQAAIGHLWEDNSLGLGLDPASGVVGDQAITTKYNDFANLRWLGKKNATTQVYSAENRDRWFCIETRMKLNTPGKNDGSFSLWINGILEAEKDTLNWRGEYTDYGINAIFLENYNGTRVEQTQSRYFDNFVVSTSRIGCYSKALPTAPSNLSVTVVKSSP